jgi:hypothetical protein
MEAKRPKMEPGSSASASVAPVTPEQQNIERYESYLLKRGLSGAAAHYLTQYLMRLEGGNTGSAANTQVFKTRLVSVAAQLSEQVQLRTRLEDTDDDPFQFTLALERVLPALQEKRQAIGATAKEMLLDSGGVIGDTAHRQQQAGSGSSGSSVAMEKQSLAEKEARKQAMTERLAGCAVYEFSCACRGIARTASTSSTSTSSRSNASTDLSLPG